MHFLTFLASLPLASATVLVKYSAADGDDTSVIGQANLQGWERNNWPSGQDMNSSAFFTTGNDPDGIPAAEVHLDEHFARSEYHALKGETTADAIYYIGYHVRFDQVDYQTIVFQWKNYDSETVSPDNIPAALVFRKDADGINNHTINFGASPDPEDTYDDGNVVWKKQLDMGKAYRFGIVINTSQDNGFIQLYFNGNPASLTDLATGDHTQKLIGNFWPGPTSDPKFGLYGGKSFQESTSYIYDIVVGTELSEIAEVAGITA